MAAAPAMIIGSTQDFRGVYPENIPPSSSVLIRRSPKMGVCSNPLTLQFEPDYQYIGLVPSGRGVIGNRFWYQPYLVQGLGLPQAREEREQRWDEVRSEIRLIANLEPNWDGEGAESVSQESIETTEALIKLAQEIEQRIELEEEQFGTVLTTLCGPAPSLLSTTDWWSTASQIALTELEPKSAVGLIGVACDAIRVKPSGKSVPELYPTVEGAVTLKWVYKGRELKCTALGKLIEVIRWKSPESYDAEGLWDLEPDQTREHFEWLMTE